MLAVDEGDHANDGARALFLDCMDSVHDRDTTVDLLQTRSLGEHRFIKRLGKFTEESMEQVAAAMAALVEYT